MVRIIVIIALLLLPVRGLAQKCAGSTDNTSERTRSGGNQLVSEIEKESTRELKGRLEDPNGKTIGHFLVEVFDKPEWILNDERSPDRNQKRLIGCEVGEEGVFRITGLKRGKYELRVSGGSPWNVSHIYVKVDPKGGKRKDLIVRMSPGT